MYGMKTLSLVVMIAVGCGMPPGDEGDANLGASSMDLVEADTATANQAREIKSIMCWSAEEYDLDRDGFADYFAHKDERVRIYEYDYTDAETLTCPPGWVKSRGDVDDNDPNVYPRRQEVAFNHIDDDGDGRIDEPTLYYGKEGYANTRSGFTMQVRIHDASTIATYNSSLWDLLVRVEYQKLSDTSTTNSVTLPVTDLWSYASYSRTDVRLTGLRSGSLYRARVQFIAGLKKLSGYTVPVGETSSWYYTMTDSLYSKTKARKRIVLRALYEQYLSARGATGYLGTYIDGTRYLADPGEQWCSEFYSWVTNFELEGMGHRSNTTRMRAYFEDRSAWEPDSDVSSAGAGDYLGIGGSEDDLYHSAMFLEYEPGRDIIWSVEGNVSGRSDIGDSYSNRRAGNETFVIQRDPGTVGGLGKIMRSMIR